MQENPYQYSGEGQATQSLSGKPAWIYAATFAAGVLSSGLPVSFFIFLVFSFGLETVEESMAIMAMSAVLAASLLVSLIVARRTWVRLNRVHNRYVGLQKKRDDILRSHDSDPEFKG